MLGYIFKYSDNENSTQYSQFLHWVLQNWPQYLGYLYLIKIYNETHPEMQKLKLYNF